MTFRVEIETDNAAFGDEKGELARILRRLADRLDDGADRGRCFDLNGNVVGRWALNEELAWWTK